MRPLPAPGQSHAQLDGLTRKQRWWHEVLCDFIMGNPTATNQQCSDYLNNQRSASTIGLIRNSDGFKALLSARRQEQKETLDAAIASKITGVAFTAFDAILDKLNKKRDTLPMNELTGALESVNRFVNGGKAGVTVNVNQNAAPTMVVPVSVADLAEAQLALRRHQQALATPVIQQPIVEVNQTEEVVAVSSPESDPGTS